MEKNIQTTIIIIITIQTTIINMIALAQDEILQRISRYKVDTICISQLLSTKYIYSTLFLLVCTRCLKQLN